MKSIFICVILFAFTVTNAQTKMFINKNSGGTDSIALSDIKSITFKTSGGLVGPTQLVYCKDVSGSSKIFIANLDGTNESQLTTGVSNEYQPKFNPDRTKIVFTSNRDGQYDVYIANIDGSGITRVTTTGTRGGHNSVGSAAWTLDGKIVYTLNDKLYKINSDGTGATAIYTAPTGLNIHTVLTSQVFNKIVVQIQGSWGYTLQHVTMNSDGTNSKVVVPDDPGGLSVGNFSPDGNKCVYSYDTTGHEEASGKGLEHHIYILDLNTMAKTDISSGKKPNGTLDAHPTFTSDGTRVLFVNGANDGSTGYALWIMNIDGTQRTKIKDGVSWLSDSR